MVNLHFGMIVSTLVDNQANPSLFNSIGGQINLHGFGNDCFAIEYCIFEDKKIVLDCYRPFETSYELFTLEVDLEINGNYILEVCDKELG